MDASHGNGVVQHLRRIMMRHGADLTDGQLLESFVSRHEESALTQLVHRHGPMVWGVCRRILVNHHDAEDALQATFLVLVRKAASVAPRERVGNWLHGVAYQIAIKARVTAARRRSREKQVDRMPEPAIMDQDLWHDLRPLLDQALIRLPDPYRAAILLCDVEGRTRKEAARQLGLPEGTVASRLARARLLLAKRLARHGLATSGVTLAVLLTQEAASAAPVRLVAATVQAAGVLASGPVAVGCVSADSLALAEGVLKTMFLTKVKAVMMTVIVAGVLGTALAGLGMQALAGQEPGDENLQRADYALVAQAQGQTEKEARMRQVLAELKRVLADFEKVQRMPDQPTDNVRRARTVLSDDLAREREVARVREVERAAAGQTVYGRDADLNKVLAELERLRAENEQLKRKYEPDSAHVRTTVPPNPTAQQRGQQAQQALARMQEAQAQFARATEIAKRFQGEAEGGKPPTQDALARLEEAKAQYAKALAILKRVQAEVEVKPPPTATQAKPKVKQETESSATAQSTSGEIDRLRRENATLRQQLEELRAALQKVNPDRVRQP